MSSSSTGLKEKDFHFHSQDGLYKKKDKALLSSFSDVVLVRDYNGRCLKILSAPPEKVYRPASELLNKTLHEGLSKEKADVILGYVRQAIETQQSVRGQYELVIQDKLVSFSAVFSPIENDRVLIVTHDVTELKQVEKQLEIHALITRSIAEGICVIRAADGTIIYSNPKFEEVFGYEPFELIGENISVLQYRSTATGLENKVSEWIERIEGKDKLVDEIHSVKKNGEDFWGRVTISLISHPKYGKVLVAIQTDITADKRTLANVQMLEKLTEDISRSEDFETAIRLILEEVGKADDWLYAEAWIPCHSERRLKCSPTFYISEKYRADCPNSEALRQFRKMSDRTPFSYGVGLPGRVYVSQTPEWQENISKLSESIFLRRSLAIECGFFAGLGIPLVAKEKVIAVIVLFRQKATSVDTHLITNLSAIAAQLNLKNSHKFLQKKLSQAQKLIEISLEAASEAVIISNNQKQIQYINSAASELIGYSQAEIADWPLTDVFESVDETTWRLVDKSADRELSRKIDRQAKRKTRKEAEQLAISFESNVESNVSSKFDSNILLLDRSNRPLAESTRITPIKSNGGERLGTVLIFLRRTSPTL